MGQEHCGERPAWRGRAEVVDSRDWGGVYHHLVLEAPEIARRALPGQFVHVLCPPWEGDGPDAPPASPAPHPGRPFLRRPISLHDTEPTSGKVSLVFRVKGPGTAALGGLTPGRTVDLIGPLGGGTFPVGDDAGGAGGTGRPEEAVIVAGGIGAAPLLLLVRRLIAPDPGGDGAHAAPEAGGFRRVLVLIGLGGSSDLVLAKPFLELAREAGGGDDTRTSLRPPAALSVEIITEDGSAGTGRGLVTDLLSARLGERQAVYACGPRPMLAAVWRLVGPRRLPAWFSVEERMACGVGACRGCAVPARFPPGPDSPDPGETRQPATAPGPAYRLVCRDGPVFPAAELDWGDPP